MDSSRKLLAVALQEYARHWPDEQIIGEFFNLLRTPAAVFQRSHREGHFTASTWLVTTNCKRVLLTHHRKLNRWLQLGGHADGDTCLSRVALREAEEESGLPNLIVDPDIFDLDRHRIPARDSEPAHWHYDVCYVAHALGSDEFTVSGESY